MPLLLLLLPPQPLRLRASLLPLLLPLLPVPPGAVSVTAPMPGNILDVKVKAGDSVKAGDTLLILEAMKMENEISAPQDGTIASVQCAQGRRCQLRRPARHHELKKGRVNRHWLRNPLRLPRSSCATRISLCWPPV